MTGSDRITQLLTPELFFATQCSTLTVIFLTQYSSAEPGDMLGRLVTKMQPRALDSVALVLVLVQQ